MAEKTQAFYTFRALPIKSQQSSIDQMQTRFFFTGKGYAESFMEILYP